MKRFKSILFVSTQGEVELGALRRAVALADNNQARLTIVSVAEERLWKFTSSFTGIRTSALDSAVENEAQKNTRRLLVKLPQTHDLQARHLVGIPHLEIIREVLRNQHDLVIKLAEEEDSIRGAIIGSDDMHLLRNCPCPVWLTTATEPESYDRILAAINTDSDDVKEQKTKWALSVQILELSASLAISESAELHIVHAWEAAAEGMLRSGRIGSPKEDVDAYVEEVRQDHLESTLKLMKEVKKSVGQEAVDYLAPQLHLLKGRARKVIPEFAAEIDAQLVVMGTVARTGISGYLIGNTAESILNSIDCSVLAIKPLGFVSPVRL